VALWHSAERCSGLLVALGGVRITGAVIRLQFSARFVTTKVDDTSKNLSALTMKKAAHSSDLENLSKPENRIAFYRFYSLVALYRGIMTVLQKGENTYFLSSQIRFHRRRKSSSLSLTEANDNTPCLSWG
jgi:hypothetical protein